METQEAMQNLTFPSKTLCLELTPSKHLLSYSFQITQITARKQAFYITLPLAAPTPIIQAKNKLLREYSNTQLHSNHPGTAFHRT